MTKEELIREITPSYNSYQAGRKSLTPVELVALMWDIGEALEKYLSEHKTAPHALYREIYGKSEGTKNVKQRSYITREFLGRSYRVKHIFSSKDDLRSQLHGLTATNHFREAMPFFDNPKYALGQIEKQALLNVINGSLSNREKEDYVQKVQAEKIGLKNPRTQQLDRLNSDKLTFASFYNDIFHAFKLADYENAKKTIARPDVDFVKILSLNSGAISADGLMMTPFDIPPNQDRRWIDYAAVVQRLVLEKSPKERRRFRRLIPPEKMIRLSEMLDALTSKDKYDRFVC